VPLDRPDRPDPRAVALARARARLADRVGELTRFGSVGALAYLVDVGLFNALRFGPGELLGDKPLTAKGASVVVATLVAWFGNRYWTFAHRRTETRGRELAAFAAVNAGGLVIGVACLAVSHYLLRLTSPLADNIAANGVGLVLGTAFRYVLYRRVVFTAVGAPAQPSTRAPSTAASPAPSPAPSPAASPAAAAHPARRDERALGQDDVGVERLRHAGQEDREDRGTPLGELEPTAVGGDQVTRERQAQARPLP
jgi:putative flippase GtrA